jgi:hypothetical protein
MAAPRQESATLPRGFRFHYQDGERPRTPEPVSISEPSQPSPPRASKLKIRRRNVLDFNFNTPTENFLASVAAADTPIPTIEVPETLPEIVQDEQMLDYDNTPYLATGFLAPSIIPNYRNSPPKTPQPHILTDMVDNIGQRPDWSAMSVSPRPDESQTRPSSAQSNPSDWSDDSYFSGSRISRPSDDGSCTSPESDLEDPFVFPGPSDKGKTVDLATVSSDLQAPQILNGDVRRKTRTGVAWSRDMSEHLWRTYQVYLGDPTVTPFRIGASCVPPEGVIHRVAREAKRSWKGPKSQATKRTRPQGIAMAPIDFSFGTIDLTGSPDAADAGKSGSITPTADPPKNYAQWPHSSAATRNHLRELCKRDSTAAHTHRYMQSKSPTPFTQDRFMASRHFRTPSAPAAFSTHEIALSLTTSTSTSMRPDGPLAKLAAPVRVEQPSLVRKFLHDQKAYEMPNNIPSESRSRRLGSPFSSRTYGPSSSQMLESLSRPLQACTQPEKTQRLGSPVQFEQSRSLNGTQKRRAAHAFDEELSSNSGLTRPSILDEQLFGGSLKGHARRVRSRGFSLGDDVLRSRIPGLFKPPIEVTLEQPISPESNPSVGSPPTSLGSTPSLLPSATFSPPTLGAPFASSGASNTFPRRLFQPWDATGTIRRRPYATMHHSRRSIESFDFGTGPSLQSRLAQLDDKLAEIREREEQGKKRPNQ